MEPDRPDVVSWGSRSSSRRNAWPVAVTLLAVALAAAIALAVHYHGQVVALRHRMRTPPTSPPDSAKLTLTTSRVALRAGKLNDTVTVISATSSTGRARIVLSGYLTGARPDTVYTLVAFDCTGLTGYQFWATGATDKRGAGLLSGRPWPVLLTDKYWLYLSPVSGQYPLGLLGTFSAEGRFSASATGNPACS